MQIQPFRTPAALGTWGPMVIAAVLFAAPARAGTTVIFQRGVVDEASGTGGYLYIALS